MAEEIKELLTEKWAEQLARCELILVSAPCRERGMSGSSPRGEVCEIEVSKRMKSTLLGTEKEPFLPNTQRIRG